MKVLFNHYKHYTEVIFPALALRYKWVAWGEPAIQEILCNHLGIPVPRYPSRRTTHPRDLRRLVALCQQIANNPSLFNQLAA